MFGIFAPQGPTRLLSVARGGASPAGPTISSSAGSTLSLASNATAAPLTTLSLSSGTGSWSITTNTAGNKLALGSPTTGAASVDVNVPAANGSTDGAQAVQVQCVVDGSGAVVTWSATVQFTAASGVQTMTISVVDELAAGARTDVPYLVRLPWSTGGTSVSAATTDSAGTTVSATVDGSPHTIGVGPRTVTLAGKLSGTVVGGVLASLSSGGSQDVVFSTAAGSDPSGTAITLADIVATGWNVSIEIISGGTTYTGNLNAATVSDTTYAAANPHYRGAYISTPILACHVISVPIKSSGGARLNDELRLQGHVYAWKTGTGAVGGGNPVIAIMTDVSLDYGSWNKAQSCPQVTSVILKDAAGTAVKTYTGSWYLHAYTHSDLWQDAVWWSNTGAARHGVRCDHPNSAGYLTVLTDNGHALPSQHNAAVLDPRIATWKSALDSHSFKPCNSQLFALHQETQGDTGGRPDIGVVHGTELPLAYRNTADGRDVQRRTFGLGMHLPYVCRDPATGIIPDIEGTAAGQYAYGGENKPAATNGTTISLDIGHGPMEGYLPAVLTGRLKFIEECHFRAFSVWAALPFGSGLTRRWLTDGQARESAWSIRNMTMALAVTPNAMGAGITGWTRSLMQTLVNKATGDADGAFVFNYHGAKNEYWDASQPGAIPLSGRFDNDDPDNFRFWFQNSYYLLPWQDFYCLMALVQAERMGVLNSDGVSLTDWTIDQVHRWFDSQYSDLLVDNYRPVRTNVGTFPKTLARAFRDTSAGLTGDEYDGRFVVGLTSYTVNAATPSAVTIQLNGASVPAWFEDGEGSFGGTRGDWFKGTGAYSGQGALWVRCRNGAGAGTVTAVSSDGKTVTIDCTVGGGATPSSGSNISPTSEQLLLPAFGPHCGIARNSYIVDGSNDSTSKAYGVARLIDLMRPGKANISAIRSDLRTRALGRTTGDAYHDPPQAGDTYEWLYGVGS